MNKDIRAYAAAGPRAELKPFSYDPGPLGKDQVEIAVQYCGICHSDLSMWDNEWQMTQYPFVPGHEVVGTVAAAGENVKHLRAGQTVGLGWYSASCMTCPTCLSGNHNLCAKNESTMIGRFGGYADRVRCHWAWAIPMPEKIAMSKAGPLMCGGTTVFNPILQSGVRPTDRVGVVGIGGLGHLALKFLSKWGCEVTAFTSSEAKADEARRFGAHHVVLSRDDGQLAKIAGMLDFILVTVNVPMNWEAYLAALGPKGRLHIVGAVGEPISLQVFSLLVAQKSVSASPLGSPHTMGLMLDFCARHGIEPTTELFPMSKANDALEHLRAGKARYRIVLKNDF